MKMAKGKEQSLFPLERVVIIGNVKIETAVLHKLALNNVSCVFLSGRNLNFRGILHGRLHQNGLLRLKQYEKSLTNFALFVARDLISTKLTKQLSFLSYLAGLISNHRFELTSSIQTINDILSNLNDQTSLDSLRGLAGSAARSYFRALTFAFPCHLNSMEETVARHRIRLIRYFAILCCISNWSEK